MAWVELCKDEMAGWMFAKDLTNSIRSQFDSNTIKEKTKKFSCFEKLEDSYRTTNFD